MLSSKFEQFVQIFAISRWTTVTYFCLTLDRPWADMAETSFKMHVQVYEHFIPTKFPKHPLRGSVLKADYVFPYTYT